MSDLSPDSVGDAAQQPRWHVAEASQPKKPGAADSPQNPPPFRGNGLTVTTGRDGFSVFANTRSGSIAIKGNERQILYRNLETIQLMEPSGTRSGSISIRSGKLGFAVFYSSSQADEARHLAELLQERQEIAKRKGQDRGGARASILIGLVEPEKFSEYLARTGKVLTYQPGVAIQAFEDRVVQGEVAHLIDETTHAQVYLDGQSQITTRPTLTRALLPSPLPGSALLPALALSKKEKNDSRTAEFQVGGKGWTFAVPVNPGRLSGPRAIAQRINSIASSKEAEAARRAAPTTHEQTAAANTAVPSPTDLVSQIERVVALEQAGAITPEQAAGLKTKLIGGI